MSISDLHRHAVNYRRKRDTTHGRHTFNTLYRSYRLLKQAGIDLEILERDPALTCLINRCSYD